MLIYHVDLRKDSRMWFGEGILHVPISTRVYLIHGVDIIRLRYGRITFDDPLQHRTPQIRIQMCVSKAMSEDVNVGFGCGLERQSKR
jgi:hypothetical protein